MSKAEVIERDRERLLEKASQEPGVAALLALHDAMEKAEGHLTQAAETYTIITSDSTNGVAFVAK